MASKAFVIAPASSPKHLAVVSQLFQAYAESLGIDLSFQDFATELAGLPGKYASPTGCLLLARDGTSGIALGCVALRPVASSRVTGKCCEMKRLFVPPAGRGTGVGRALVEAVVREASALGYERVYLDTLASMAAAQGLYRSLGFVDCEPYYNTPLGDTVFLRLTLRGDEGGL